MTALTKAEQRLLEDYEHIIEQGQQWFLSTGHALIAIRDKELYRAAHKTFEDYCRDRWQLSRPRAYQLISAVEVDETLSTMVDKSELVGGGLNERQTRELVGLPEEKVADVVSKAMQKAKRDEDGKAKLTAKGIREAKQEVLGPNVIEGECEPHTDKPPKSPLEKIKDYWKQLDTKCRDAFLRWANEQVAKKRPTIEQVREYCKERKQGVDPEAWYAHYEANGWKVGRNPMKDWKAAVRTWEHSDLNPNRKKPSRDVLPPRKKLTDSRQELESKRIRIIKSGVDEARDWTSCAHMKKRHDNGRDYLAGQVAREIPERALLTLHKCPKHNECYVLCQQAPCQMNEKASTEWI
jgi:hypothetical protein